jgi:tRNA pseudouridine32 synthase/23S rRNA pseudouridine746 synthase
VLPAPVSRWRAPARDHPHRERCAALGIPIGQGEIYPVHPREKTDGYRRSRQLLAKTPAFTDPVGGGSLRFTSERMFAWPKADQLVWEALFLDVTR